MRRVWIILAGLAVGLACRLDAQQAVKTVVPVFPGNGHSEKFLSALRIPAGSVMPADSLETLGSLVLNWYYRRGFWSARIDSTAILEKPGRQAECRIWISDGEPVRVGNVSLSDSGGTVPKPAVFETVPGAVFDQDAAERDVRRLLDQLENEGHPLAEIRIEPRIADMNSIITADVGFRVNPGQLVRIGKIQTEGQRITRPDVIIRETRLVSGAIYRQREIDAGRENLIKTGLFEATPPRVLFTNGAADVTYVVKELQSNTLDGVIGYQPSETNGRPGTLTGRLEFQFRNLLGTGRLLDVYWEKKDALSQAMRFGYEEPWLFGRPIFLGGRFQQDIRDSTYLEREWRVWLRYAPSVSLNWKAEAGQKNVLPDSLGGLAGIPNAKILFVTAGVELNTLDDPLNPRRGIHYETRVTYGRRTVPDSSSSTNVRRIDVSAEGVLPLWGTTAAYLKLTGSEYRNGGIVPASEQIRFGGARTVRGYPEDAFRGTLVAWANAEYRLLSGKSRVFVFCDFGAYQRQETTGRVSGAKLGYGFGLRIDTSVGLFGIDYGLGEGDGFMRGKIHVGLVNRF